MCMCIVYVHVHVRCGSLSLSLSVLDLARADCHATQYTDHCLRVVTFLCYFHLCVLTFVLCESVAFEFSLFSSVSGITFISLYIAALLYIHCSAAPTPHAPLARTTTQRSYGTFIGHPPC